MRISPGQLNLTLPVVLSVAALAGGAAAQQNPRPTVRKNHDIQVTVKTVEEDVIRGTLAALSLTDGAIIHTEGAGEQHVPTPDLVRVNTTASVSERNPQDLTFTLTGGDVLHGRLVEGKGVVVLETVDLGPVRIPLDSIERLDAACAFHARYRESVAWFDRAQPTDADRTLLTNGDVAEGFVSAIGADGVSIEGTFGETLVPHRLVVAVRLATARPTPAQSPYFRVTLRTSGRIAMTGFDWSGGVAQARLRHGGHVRVEAVRIVSVDAVGGRWEWLSLHQPISYEHTPMLSLDWPYMPDRNVLGGPITVAGETFEHGVGVHSRSSLTYDLQGAYREFVTSFGVDDNSGPNADVSVFVLVDGKRRFDQAHIRPGKLFGPIRLDITQANRIELIVDFGDNGDLQDRVNWVEAALIR
jgi:hypothetical protein